jgi:anti-anti-sigma regulatory factor
MLKITIHNSTNAATLNLEGRLAGPWVEELERSWRAVKDDSREKPVIVDLCEVTFVDAEGRKLLSSMYEQGARLRTFGCMAKGVVDEIVQAHGRSG